MHIRNNDVIGTFRNNQFDLTNQTKKVVEFQSRKTGENVYFRLYPSDRDYVRLVIHPERAIKDLATIPGVTGTKDQLQHGSNMRRFPKRLHTGSKEINFGIALNLDSLNSVDAFLKVFH